MKSILLPLLGGIFCSTIAVHAAIQYWDPDGSAAGNSTVDGTGLGGPGTWSTAGLNWWDGASGTDAAWTDGNDAIFWGTAGTVTNLTSRTANSLTFKTGGYL